MPLEQFDDVAVVPYAHLLKNLHGGLDHQGGPIWPDWDAQTGARFVRAGKLADDRPDDPAEVVDMAGDRWAWGGPITGHFGHWVSDYSTRIVETLAEKPDAILVFASEIERPVASFDALPKWLQEALAWLGVRPEATHFVTRPTRFEKLSVAPQAEYFGVAPSEAYLDLLDEVGAARLGPVEPGGTVYVSRAALSGRFAGERELERAFAAAGFTIFRPETVDLIGQLKVYAGAERLVFAEGSALHGCQLLGRALGDVHVICRRRGFRMVQHALTARARALTYHDCVAGLVHGLTAAGSSAAAIGISIPDYARLHGSLSAAGVDAGAPFDPARFGAAVRSDVVEWLRNEAARPSTRLVASRDCIYKTLAAFDGGSLVHVARDIFNDAAPAAAGPNGGQDRMSAPDAPAPPRRRSRAEIIQSFLNLYDAPRYLEIGVQAGVTFNELIAARKVAVDPKFEFDTDAFANERTTFHEIPSDAYFATPSFSETFDVVFLDGLHTFEQTLRDFLNAICRLNEGGVIVIDDTIPNSYHASLRSHAACVRVRQHIGSADRAWMGDVYKLVFFIQSFCQSFSYATASDSHGVAAVWRSTRAQAPDRLVSVVGSMSFDLMVEQKASYNFLPSDEIVALVAQARAKPSPG